MAISVRLIGVPTDINSSFARGAALAPARIRAALWSDRGNLACENGLEIGNGIALADGGDLPLAEDPAADDLLIAASVRDTLRRGAAPILLGGDHSITLPALRAMHEHFGPVTILHFDAHPDLYDDFEGNPRSHASPFARIMEERLASRLVQVGIRTANAHCRAQAARFGVETVPIHGFTPEGVPALTAPVYVSLDLDALDPAHAPGVSHPEPGGLTVREVLQVLDRCDGMIAGADIVECNPRFDRADVTAITAAKFVREIAARMAATKRAG
jgi:agmatinase